MTDEARDALELRARLSTPAERERLASALDNLFVHLRDAHREYHWSLPEAAAVLRVCGDAEITDDARMVLERIQRQR